MPIYSMDEMKNELKKVTSFQKFLYCKGFLLSTQKFEMTDEYPFYGNWKEQILSNQSATFYLYTHADTKSYVRKNGERIFFLIGHAYDPFHMIINEDEILYNLEQASLEGEKAFWDSESDLSGVFCICCINNEKLMFTSDCCGMQLSYHGMVGDDFYLTSHSKLVGDLVGLEQTEYIKRLVSSRFWRYFGTWLPGDVSPYKELRHTVPNIAFYFNYKDRTETLRRFYPDHKIEEIQTEDEFQKLIAELGIIMSDTMRCVADKWADRKLSISVTGGRDSLSALSCTNGIYDRFRYFSYISNPDEKVDADAAKTILANLDLEQELYIIPDDWDGYKNKELFRAILEYNAGCIGKNNENDVKKRLYFTENPPCEVEVKSWVNEMGRGWYQNKFNKTHFPKYPYAAYWRAMHKVLIDPYLIHETNKVFKEYLSKYYSKTIFDRVDWKELYFWEFAWSGGEGVFLTCEHRVPYEITIPFNNRKYVELMLKVPIARRMRDEIPNALIDYMEPRISATGIAIKDVSHTDRRANMERIHLELSSKLLF